VFVESHPRAQRLIAANLSRCGIEEGYAIVRASASRAVESFISSKSPFVPFDIIFLDPPYDQVPHDVLIGVDRLLASDGVAVLEHARRTESPAVCGRLERIRVLNSGDSALSFYVCQP
jgi:16S rRNA G966 N2-methylase RsmD